MCSATSQGPPFTSSAGAGEESPSSRGTSGACAEMGTGRPCPGLEPAFQVRESEERSPPADRARQRPSARIDPETDHPQGDSHDLGHGGCGRSRIIAGGGLSVPACHPVAEVGIPLRFPVWLQQGGLRQGALGVDACEGVDSFLADGTAGSLSDRRGVVSRFHHGCPGWARRTPTGYRVGVLPRECYVVG
jgi:hypothetical protein